MALKTQAADLPLYEGTPEDEAYQEEPGTDLAPVQEYQPPATYDPSGFDDAPSGGNQFDDIVIQCPRPHSQAFYDNKKRPWGTETLTGYILGISMSYISRGLGSDGQPPDNRTDVIYSDQQPMLSDSVKLGAFKDRKSAYESIFGSVARGLPDNRRFNRKGETLASIKAGWRARGLSVDSDAAQMRLKMAMVTPDPMTNGEIVEVQFSHWQISRFASFKTHTADRLRVQLKRPATGTDLAAFFQANPVRLSLDKPQGVKGKEWYPWKIELAR